MVGQTNKVICEFKLLRVFQNCIIIICFIADLHLRLLKIVKLDKFYDMFL